MTILKPLALPALALLLLPGCSSKQYFDESFVRVTADFETEAVPSVDDAADDPVVWVNPSNPLRSLIIGTDKHYGLMVYDLDGRQVQALERGRLNNVDLRQGVQLEEGEATLAVATNRSTTGLDIFRVADDGDVSLLRELPLELEDPYGVCMHLDREGQAHVFVNSSDGAYQHWLLNPGRTLAPRRLHEFRLKSQPEGCAVDDFTATLYFGEEEYGIWMLPVAEAGNAQSAMRLLDRVDSPYLKADIEGMDIYRRDQRAYLLVSSQGNNSYALYDLNAAARYRGSFHIVDDPGHGVDGVQETDGLAISAAAFGMDYPEGLLVVQDGYNTLPEANQNFKVLSWLSVESALLGNDD